MLKMTGEQAVDTRKWLSAGDFASPLGMPFLFDALTACKFDGMIGFGPPVSADGS